MMQRILLFMFSCTVTFGSCPTPTVDYAWPTRTIVYFDWPASGTPPFAYTKLSVTLLGIEDDLSSAFSNWSYANVNSNLTSTIFSFFSGYAAHGVYAYRVNFPGDSLNGDPGRAAVTLTGLYGGTRVVASAETTLYYGAQNRDFGYSLLDASAPNYHEFVVKLMMHEIGHDMGLTDQNAPFTAGESIMNGQSGTNDIGNLIPSNITGCDNSAVH